MHKLCVCYTYVSYINHYCCISMQRDILLAVCLYSSYDSFGEPVRSSVLFFSSYYYFSFNNKQPSTYTRSMSFKIYITASLSTYNVRCALCLNSECFMNIFFRHQYFIRCYTYKYTVCLNVCYHVL